MRYFIGLIISLFVGYSSLFANPIGKEYQNLINQINKPFHSLWGIEFSPNAIFVDTEANKMFIITAGKSGEECSVLESDWNNEVFPANSVVKYKGIDYLTINLLTYNSMDPNERKSLFAHEGFHYYQDSIWHPMVNSKNSHLDGALGRTLLHMELDALNAALSGDSSAIVDALYIRVYRQMKFPENNENEFECHEGVAEYTGIKCAYGDSVISQLLRKTDYNDNMGYTNSFAYKTMPIYLYFTDKINPKWNKTGQKDLTFDLKTMYEVDLAEVENKIASIKAKYNYEKYLTAENNMMPNINLYLPLLDSGSEKFTIYNNGVGMMFNPNDRVFGISDNAVLHNNVQLKGEWGALIIKEGVVKMNDWSKFILLPPTSVDGNNIMGNNYQLTLNPTYQITKENNEWKISAK